MAEYALVVLRDDGLVYWYLQDHQDEPHEDRGEGEFRLRRTSPFTPKRARERALTEIAKKGVQLDPEAVAVVRVEASYG